MIYQHQSTGLHRVLQIVSGRYISNDDHGRHQESICRRMLYISHFTMHGDGVQANWRTFGTGFESIFIQTIRLLGIRGLFVTGWWRGVTYDEFKDIII